MKVPAVCMHTHNRYVVRYIKALGCDIVDSAEMVPGPLQAQLTVVWCGVKVQGVGVSYRLRPIQTVSSFCF